MSDLKITFTDQEPPDIDYKKAYENQRYVSKQLINMMIMQIDALNRAFDSDSVREPLARTRGLLADLLLKI